MVREFELPDIGEGLTEAEVLSWLVEPGDTVTEDQPVAEVETDKAVVEVPSPVDGTVRTLHATEGDVVAVGAVFVTFETGDGDKGETTDGSEEAVAADTDGTGGRVFASPTARRVARELGVDIESVPGSGPGGRVTEGDVRTAAEDDEAKTAVRSAVRRVDEATESHADDARGREQTVAAPAARRLAAEEGVDIDAVPGEEAEGGEAVVTVDDIRAYVEERSGAEDGSGETTTSAGGESSATHREVEQTEATDGERVPYRGIRRSIGEQMERSKREIPHASHFDEADVTRLVELRERLNEKAAERDVKLSYLPFVLQAVVAGLKRHPYLNARLDTDTEEIVLQEAYNLGIATATDRGLVVPVVEDADRRGLLELADEIERLAAAARDRSIDPEEMQGGTFTVTNFGVVGGEHAVPIINHPEVAILGVGEIRRKPRVVDSATDGPTSGRSDDGEPFEPDGSVPGEVVPRYVMPLSMSIDHRVVDGAEAAAFLNTVIEYLEDPEFLLLE
ncbi:MAG: dihydrolipoamide acetyltransferase family protein [Natronomonas sp.]